jgi:hypothetical protein
MTAAMKWTVVTRVSAHEVHFVLPRLASGRNNKDAPTCWRLILTGEDYLRGRQHKQRDFDLKASSS